jgi:PAS fold
MQSEMERSRKKVTASGPPFVFKTTQSAATRDQAAGATAMRRDILHFVDAAGFLESAPDAMIIVDQQGRILAVNTVAEKLFGYRREELIGELVEMQLTDRSWNCYVDPRRRLLIAIRDFIEIERMKEQLRQGAEELQKVMEIAPVALVVSHDPECHEITGNRAGNPPFEGQEETNPSLRPADGSFPNGRYFRDGVAKVIWGTANPLRDATGDSRGEVAADQAVTAIRRRTEAALLQSREQTQLAVDLAQLGLWGCILGSDKIGSRRAQRELRS